MQYVKEQTLEICMAAAVYYVKEQTYKICKAALKQDQYVHYHIGNKIWDLIYKENERNLLCILNGKM